MTMKTLRCRDAGFDCDQEIHAPTDEAVLKQAAEHAQSVHHINVTPALAEQIRGLIRDENREEQ